MLKSRSEAPLGAANTRLRRKTTRLSYEFHDPLPLQGKEPRACMRAGAAACRCPRQPIGCRTHQPDGSSNPIEPPRHRRSRWVQARGRCASYAVRLDIVAWPKVVGQAISEGFLQADKDAVRHDTQHKRRTLPSMNEVAPGSAECEAGEDI